jgi:hypothetical protein
MKIFQINVKKNKMDNFTKKFILCAGILAVPVSCLCFGFYRQGEVEGYRDGLRNGLNAPYSCIDKLAKKTVEELSIDPLIDQKNLDISGLKVVSSSCPERSKSYDYSGICSRLSYEAKRNEEAGNTNAASSLRHYEKSLRMYDFQFSIQDFMRQEIEEDRNF